MMSHLIILFFITLLGVRVTQAINHVEKVDLHTHDNTVSHHTDLYRMATPSIVLRRGEQLHVSIYMTSNYNQTDDRIRLELTSGSRPQVDKGTLFYLPLRNDTVDTNQLFAKVKDVEGRKIAIVINLPATMAVGVWNFRISTKTANAPEISSFLVLQRLYIIFNPWNQLDDVYLDDEAARKEYVLNPIGIIYTNLPARGRRLGIKAEQWIYGQFESQVLTAVMLLLERSRIDMKTQSDVVAVSRTLSAIVNAQDDDGLLVGSWPDDGVWRDGTSPYNWHQSPIIFYQYLIYGGRPVKYAQCWVFAAVLTTALRALGIPARSVTNFYSAHDTDRSLTIDEFYDAHGNKLPKAINSDMIWNFHVWSEGMMKRHDLPAGYDGWQVLDATPQEKSTGKYQLGPASVKAIKQGKVTFAYDVGFVYSEVNADKVYWKLDHRSANWRKTAVDPSSVGLMIITKQIGSSSSQDLTSEYKYPERTSEERLSFREASKAARLLSIMHR